MGRRFQFSVKRLLGSTGLFCISLALIGWAIAWYGPAVPFPFVYLATITLGVAGSNLVGRPLYGAVVVTLFWTGFMTVSAAFNAPWWISRGLLLTVIVVAAFFAGIVWHERQQANERPNRSKTLRQHQASKRSLREQVRPSDRQVDECTGQSPDTGVGPTRGPAKNGGDLVPINRRFQFSVQRLLASVGLLCVSLGLLTWAIGPLPLIFFYFATIVFGVAAANLFGRPLLGAVVVLLSWTGFMLISEAINGSLLALSTLLTAAVLVPIFLGGMATQRHLDQRKVRKAVPVDLVVGIRSRDLRDVTDNPSEEAASTAHVRPDD